MNLYINKNNTHTEILQSLKEKVQAESELGETEMTLIFVKITIHFYSDVYIYLIATCRDNLHKEFVC